MSSPLFDRAPFSSLPKTALKCLDNPKWSSIRSANTFGFEVAT